MVARGHVRNGVVVLEDGVQLPEGMEVTVVVPPSARNQHGVLDIRPVSVGAVVAPISAEVDVLGEMLESRQ